MEMFLNQYFNQNTLWIFSDDGYLQRNYIWIALALAVILLVAGIVYFYPWIIVFGINSIMRTLELPFPDPWPYLEPVMSFLNVLCYILGAIAVYLIGREYIVADRYTYFAVSAYLLYFPLAGINWSTFTTISLFPTLFLLGFYFYKIELRLISGIFFILAASTVLFYTIPIILAGFIAIVSDKGKGITVKENHYAVSLILIALFIFFMEAIHGYIVGYYGYINISTYGILTEIVKTVTYAKPLFFIGLMVPLITFGFFGPRMLPVSIPYFIFGVIVSIAGNSPEPLVAILDVILPFAFIGSLHWIGNRVEVGIIPTETKIIRFALFSLILMNILVIVTYFPFLSILGQLLGI